MESIAHTADGFDVAASRFKLGAQSLDMRINGAGIYALAVLPDPFQEKFPGFHLPHAFDQAGQQFKLRKGQLSQLALGLNGLVT